MHCSPPRSLARAGLPLDHTSLTQCQRHRARDRERSFGWTILLLLTCSRLKELKNHGKSWAKCKHVTCTGGVARWCRQHLHFDWQMVEPQRQLDGRDAQVEAQGWNPRRNCEVHQGLSYSVPALAPYAAQSQLAARSKTPGKAATQARPETIETSWHRN